MKKHIIIIATGGTIAGSGEAGKAADYQAGRIDVSEIVRSVPAISHLAELTTIQLCNIDSNDMTEDTWLRLRDQINAFGSDPDVDGIVVTHGTDTLEETAFFLNLTVNHRKPVVLTGSMRPATAASADGPMNLYQAVALAASEEAVNAGVLAVFSDTIYSGRDIQKINSYKTDAFEIGDFGCLGYMRDDQVYFLSKTDKPHTADSIFAQAELSTLPKVAIAYYHCGADRQTLELLSEHCNGLVIAGSGSGNYSSAWKETIHRLAETKIIVRSSRVLQGIVFDSPFFDPGHDTIPSYTLSPQKARILLMLALSVTGEREQIRTIFETY